MALIGFAVWLIGAVVAPVPAFAAFLAAYATGVSLALGVLVLVMTAHLSGAAWFAPLRRLALAIAGTLPLFALLFLILLPGVGALYPWVHGTPMLGARRAYLTVPFFVGRAAAYFALWIAAAVLLARRSVEAGPDSWRPSRGERGLAAALLPPVGIALTFAAFDWLMSLRPEWSSTIYGVYVFAGGMLGALALVAVAGFALERAGPLGGAVGTRQYHALGKLLLTFVIFWAYIAFCQLLIIWIGDVPAEVAWYVPRLRGSWTWLSALLAAGQFALPFLLLLFRSSKTRPAVLVPIAAWLLVMHYLDVYWLVAPELPPGARPGAWLDLSALAAVGGSAVAFGVWRARRLPLLVHGGAPVGPAGRSAGRAAAGA